MKSKLPQHTHPFRTGDRPRVPGRQVHMGLSILSHNLCVLARLKIAQEKARRQAA